MACDVTEHVHTYSEDWTKNETHHWHAATCEHKDLTKDEAPHTYGENNKCTVCGADKPVAPHEHTFSNEWTTNETHHWHAATCEHRDLTKEYEKHTIIDGVCSKCGYQEETLPTDTDFDGLNDEIDPDPTNNKYLAKFKKPTEEDEAFTDTYEFEVDYRDFIYDEKPTFNANVCKIESMFSLDAYFNKEKAYIQNNVYQNDDSKIFNLYVQFGIENIEYRETETIINDPNKYDGCGLFLGFHDFYYQNESYRIFFATVRGYKAVDSWGSNLDIGANTENYRKIANPGEEWNDVTVHKGFNVSVNRAYPLLEDYINTYKKNNFKNILYITGQSRGAAIGNLLSKQIIDNHKEIKTCAYCFNCPNVVTGKTKNELEQYDGIFKLICKEDLVSTIPLKSWGFDAYGITYEFSQQENKEEYKRFLKHEFDGLTNEAMQSIISFLGNLIKTREDIYNFREQLPEENNVELISAGESRLEAMVKYNSLKNSITDKVAKKTVNVEEPVEKGDEWKIQISTRPAMLQCLVGELTSILSKEDYSVVELLLKVNEYRPFLVRYIEVDIPTLLLDQGMEGFKLSQILNAHTPLTAICSAYTAKKK